MEESWLDAEARDALMKIRGSEAAKKRATVILLAAAAASDTPMVDVFRDERACNRRIWYEKWQHNEKIAAALDVCTGRALAWRDAETARIESDALQRRRRAIAQGSLDAVQGLRITALNREDRADYRTEASRVLISLADPDLAERLERGQAASIPVEVTDAPPLVQVVMPHNSRDQVQAAAGDGDDG